MLDILSDYTCDAFSYKHSLSKNHKESPISINIHSSYELNYTIRGDITYLIEGQEYKLSPHDILVINNRELHKPILLSNEFYERITIHFKPEFVLPFQTNEINLLNCFEKRKLGHQSRIRSDNVIKYKIDNYFREISCNILNYSTESFLIIKLVFARILVELNRIYKNEGILVERNSNIQNIKITSILEYINSNLNDDITLSELEKKFYINKYYLSHAFKKTTGFSVMDYVIYKRIIFAKELIVQGSSAVDACYESGYRSYSNFYKAFKRITGTSPNEYANK